MENAIKILALYMSIGQCPLGYAYKEINDSVKNAIDRGSTSTLNSYEEFY